MISLEFDAAVVSILLVSALLGIDSYKNKDDYYTTFRRYFFQYMSNDCYLEQLTSNIEESSQIDETDLRANWKVVYDPDILYSDHIGGWIVDEQDVPIIAFRGKTSFYDRKISTDLVPEKIRPQLKEENEKRKRERDSINIIKAMMPAGIYSLYSQVLKLLYEDNCYRGYGKTMSFQVDLVLDWYQNNKIIQDQMDEFLRGTTPAATQFKEFLEMFLVREDLILVQQLCESMDAGIVGVLGGGVLRHNNLYIKWKKIKAEPQKHN